MEDSVSVTNTQEEAHEVKSLSPTQLILKRFFRSKLSIVGLSLIAFLFIFSFLGPALMFVPGVPVYGQFDRFLSDDITVMAEQVRVGTDGEYFFYVTFTQQETAMLHQPRARNVLIRSGEWSLSILGTDEMAYDIFSRLMYGGRISLMIAFMVVFISTFIGVLLGSIAGYFGKWVDQAIMRLVDLFMCIPTLPILLIVGAGMDVPGNTVGPFARIFILMAMLAVLGWAGTARLVRGQILMLKEQDYMLAAEAMGLSIPRRIFRHLIPNVMPQLIVSMTLGLGGVILSEATLSFLGFGVQMPYAAWGTMIGRLEDFNILQNHVNLWVPPGILIMMAVLGFNFIGDGLRDAFDPKMKR